jgi:hypothetical protein
MKREDLQEARQATDANDLARMNGHSDWDDLAEKTKCHESLSEVENAWSLVEDESLLDPSVPTGHLTMAKVTCAIVVMGSLNLVHGASLYTDSEGRTFLDSKEVL